MDPDGFILGWLLVTFDLPTTTKAARKAASDFREWLKDDGYQMMQWSVYARPCVTFSRQQTHLDRLRLNLPPRGSVRAMFVTRSQWAKSFVMHGTVERTGPPLEEIPRQILLW
jgi:CRISPR-associated protein Cas2